MDLDIGEVVRHTGVPASTLRYYEEKKLITSTGRRGQRRLFAPEVVQQLAMITIARAAGFTLDDIAHMFAANGQPGLDKQLLAAKADELDHTITQLTTMRDSLRHAAACPAPSHMECPTFTTLLAAVSETMAARPKKTAARGGQ